MGRTSRYFPARMSSVVHACAVDLDRLDLLVDEAVGEVADRVRVVGDGLPYRAVGILDDRARR